MQESGLSRRSLLTFLASVPLWVALPGGRLLAATLRVRQLRHWSAPDHTRVVLDLDAEAHFDTRLLHEPERLLVEIRGGEIARPQRIPVQDGLVRTLSIEPSPGGVLVQVVLEREAGYAAFPLPPNAGSRSHRIVLDVLKRLTETEKRAQEREVEQVRQSGDVVIAVDAGHGGNDPGCVGRDLVEKEVALDVARRLAAILDSHPGRRSVLTRGRDYFVPLAQRPQFARRFGAQVFVSIHANSAASSSARGSEVYFLSLQAAADKAARDLVDRENAADLVGGVPPERIQEPLVEILMNLKQNDTIRRSERLGELVLRRLEQVPGGESRGLKQGPLAVLKSFASPSVLVELGFVTNARDARLMRSPAALQRYAAQLAVGIEDYLAEAR